MPEAPDAGSMDRGSLTAVLCNLGGLALASYLRVDIFFSGFGIMQVLWLGPLWKYYQHQGKTEDAKGLLVVAGITLLLNAACWAAMKV